MTKSSLHPASHWAQALAEIPPIVVLACADNHESSAAGHALYCLTDGSIAIAPAGRMGQPSLLPVISTLTELVWIAYRREYSNLQDVRLRTALDFPNEYGELVFCTGDGVVELSQAERDELIEKVITNLSRRWASDHLSFLDDEMPKRLVASTTVWSTRARDITPEFTALCRQRLRARVVDDLDSLLAQAEQRCEGEAATAGSYES